MNLNVFRNAVLLLAISVSFSASAQFPEGFETTVPPAGWVAYNNGIGVTQDWQANATSNSGAQAAYVRYENVTGIAEDWLVTPLVPITAGANILEFYQRQSFSSDFGSIYTVRVSTTSQMTGFTTVDSQVETDFNLTYAVHYVDLSAYIGQSVYIAFVMENDDGDNWFVDDVNLVSTPCIAPTNLQANAITTNSADLSWTPASGGTDFQVAVLPTGSPVPTTAPNIVGTTFNSTLLNAATVYDYYVREACAPTEPLIITAVYDGPLAGGHPKGIELYVIEDISDLSIYGVSSANNGTGTTITPEYTFPSGSFSAGSYIYVAADSTGFADFFGFNANYISGFMAINGDDAIELYKDGTVIDVFGDVNVDGTGQTWDHLDGWAARITGSLTNGGVFVDTDWTYSGINALDNETTNATAATPVPVGVFTTAGDYSPWVMNSFTTLCGSFAGDSIQDPILVASLPYSDTSNTALCFTDQIGNVSNDVFYQYIVTDSCMTSIDISLCNSSFDTYLHVYDNQLVELDFNDDACGTRSELLGYAVTAGDTLNIVVEGYASNNGDFILDITPNYAPAPVLTTQMNVVCAADTNGMATFNTGDPSATYQWDANAGNQTDSTAMNLGTGMYYVTVSYPGGCVFTDSVEIISSSPAISTNPVVTNVVCFGGSNGTAVLNETGGTAPLTVDWGTEDPNSLGAGTFTYTVTDNVGCTQMDSVVITEPMMISTNPTVSDVNCFGGNDGTVVLNETGGTAPLSVDWGTEDPNSLSAGTFTYTVTDTLGCSYMDSVVVIEPTAIALSGVSSDETMGNDGSIDLTVSGGTSPYTYAWTNGASSVEDPSGLAGNMNYTVTVTDDNGCVDTLSVYVGSVVSLSHLTDVTAWNVYPNPSSGLFTLEAKGQTGSYELKGVNALGQVVMTETIDASVVHEFDFSSFERGTYTLILKSSEGSLSHLRVVLL